MVYTPVLGTGAVRHGGSSPLPPTKSIYPKASFHISKVRPWIVCHLEAGLPSIPRSDLGKDYVYVKKSNLLFFLTP